MRVQVCIGGGDLRPSMCCGPGEEHAVVRPKGTHRVLMWAPPRSLSTCVERAFIEHRPFASMSWSSIVCISICVDR